jgi:putative transposase
MSHPKSIKTLEFKLSLNTSQAAKIEAWLDVQRWAWNRGLRYLIEYETFFKFVGGSKKQGKACMADSSHGLAPCCPITWEYRWLKGRHVCGLWVDDTDGAEWMAAPFSRILPDEKNPEPNYFCPINQDHPISHGDWNQELANFLVTPPSKDRPNNDYSIRSRESALMSLMGKKRNPILAESDCPSPIINRTISKLCAAWDAYKNADRPSMKRPRFKTRKGRYAIKTLSCKAANGVVIDGSLAIFKGVLGRLRVRSLDKRWPDGLRVNSYEIKKEPSGYYLLLVGELSSPLLKPSEKVAGFDAGIVHILNDDAGHHIDMPLPLQRRLKALKRLQRAADRCKKGSENQRKLYGKIALLHEKIARDRKAWHHKLTTFAVRKYGSIAVEDLKLANMTRRPKPKPNDEGTGFDPNMAAAKAGLNRKLLDAGIGGLYTMMEAKAKAGDREFVRVPPQYTSQTCNACGVVDKASRLTQSKFVCTGCGHTENADTNAARNIRDIGFPERARYPALAGEFMPSDLASVPELTKEGAQAPPRSDAPAISLQGALPVQRDLSAVADFQPMESPKPVSSKGRKSRSAQVELETPTQLSLWGGCH